MASGAGAFGIRCGELARSRESDWLSLVKILILLVSVDRWTDGHLEYRSHKREGVH